MKKIILLLGILLLIAGCTTGSNADGTATDSIARVSYGGWIWKTWRVELTNDHPISDGEGGVIQQRYGIINDPSLIQKVSDLAATGKKVKIYYHGNMFVLDWEYSDAEVIYKVEEIQ